MHFNTLQDDLIEDNAVVDKLNLSMHSKPSGATSGRITPPSGYSSSRRNTMLEKNGDQLNSGSRKTPGHEGEGTGSVQMSNDQSAGDIFMQQMQTHQKSINQ